MNWNSASRNSKTARHAARDEFPSPARQHYAIAFIAVGTRMNKQFAFIMVFVCNPLEETDHGTRTVVVTVSHGLELRQIDQSSVSAGGDCGRVRLGGRPRSAGQLGLRPAELAGSVVR